MSARSCAYCNCGDYDDGDGRTRPDTGTPICWCGHTENEHYEGRV